MLENNDNVLKVEDTPTGGDIFVSVEMSRSKWVIGLHTPSAGKIALHAMACGDVDALLALIDRTGSRLGTGIDGPTIIVCYEAGYEDFWLHRRLTALGIRVVVIDPASLLVDQPGQARQDGSDR